MTYKEFATFTAEKAFAELKSSSAGLSSVVADRLAAQESNSIEHAPPSGIAILWRQLRSPMVLVLFVAFIVAFFTKDVGSSITIFIFMAVNTALGFTQEYRSEHVIEKLNTYIATQVTVRRNGALVRVPKEQIVPGDYIALEAGDAFPADARIVRAENLLVDESVLTGESAPASKNEKSMVDEPGTPADATNVGFAGTAVAAGRVEAVVFAIGKNTVFGGIASQTTKVKRASIFEQNINSFSRFIVKIVVATLTAIYVANLLIKGSAANPTELLLFSLALAVSVIPEALPAVITITFSKGALLLAKKKVVIKRLSAIEDLGHIEILCTDKTGTITENKLSVGRIACHDANACVLAALFSSEPPDDRTHAVTSFDSAIWQFASVTQRAEASTMVRKAEIPFDPERRRNTTIVERDGSRMLSVKGAPEDILNLCRVTGAESESVLKEFHAMGTEGMRVLALAQREVGVKDTYGPSDEEGAQFIGLVGFIDPLKPTAKDAITLAERLNVRVKIVTGDSLEVAAAVGIKVGVIDTVADAISGTSLAALTDAEFADAVERYDVFARITPELKFKIVSVLEKKHATGFLGEGINDAPALKEANVAMVVAGAADVAREAADVVLLDRSLSVVIDAIKEGRTMYANVLKYIKYTLVGNFGNFYSIAIISLFIKFLPLTPEQILLINLLTDFPLIAVATDTVDLEELATPRRFNIKKIALYTTVLGLVSTVFDLIFFGIFRHSEPGMLQTLWFYESVLSEVVLIFALRTNRFVLRARPPAYLLTSLAVVTVIITIALPFTSFGQSVFHFVSPGSGALVAIFLIVAAYFMTTEAAKLAYQRLWGKASLASGRS